MGAAAARRAERPAAHHLRGGRRASTSSIKGSERVTGWEPVERDGVDGVGAERAVRLLQPVRGGDRRGLDRLPEQGLAAEAPRRRLPQRAQLLRGAVRWRRCRIRRCAPRCSTTGPGCSTGSGTPSRPGYVWYAEVGDDDDDDLGELPGRGPERGTGRDQRAPLGLLPDRAPPRLHHRPRLRAGAGRLPVDPADRRPAGPDRPQLGQGLDHRGQRHPRRQVLGDLDRQGGVDRPQLRDRRAATSPATSTSSSRCSPPARSGGTRSTSARTSSAATRSTTAARTASSVTSAASSRRSRTTTSTTSPSSGSSTATRSAASSCTRPSTWSIRHNRIHDCSLGTWLDWQTQGTRISRNVYYDNNRDLFVEVSHGPVPRRAQHPRVRRRRCESVQPGRRVRATTWSAAPCGSSPCMDRATPYHVPHSTQVAGYAVIYGGDDRYVGNLFLGGDARPRLRARVGVPPDAPGTARPATTATRPRSTSTSRASTSSPPGDHQRFPGVQAARRTSAATSTPAGHARRTPSRTPSSSTATASVDGRRRGRRGLPGDPAARGVRRAPASASSPGGTWSACASSTPTSRSATAPRVVMDVDLIGERKEHGQNYPAGPIAALRPGTTRLRVW